MHAHAELSIWQASGRIELAKDTVVLDPIGWLSRLVGAFVNDLEGADSAPRNGLYSEHEVRVLCSALSDTSESGLKLTAADMSTIIELLCVKLELAVQLESGTLFVPSMLPLASEADPRTFLDAASDVVSCGRQYRSASTRDHIPPGVFASLHVLVLRSSEYTVRASWANRVVFSVKRRECVGMEVRVERDQANSSIDFVVSAPSPTDAIDAVACEWHRILMRALRAKAPGLKITCSALCYRCLGRRKLRVCTFPIKLGDARYTRDIGSADGEEHSAAELEGDDPWCETLGEPPQPLDAMRLLRGSNGARAVPSEETSGAAAGQWEWDLFISHVQAETKDIALDVYFTVDNK